MRLSTFWFSPLKAVFKQSTQLQRLLHAIPELKHSQYSLRQLDFLHLHLLVLRIWSRIPPTVLGGRDMVVLLIMEELKNPFEYVDRGAEDSLFVESLDDIMVLHCLGSV
jgi:hypothetical protein